MAQALNQAPHDETSFVNLRNTLPVYVDKTRFIHQIEQCGSRFPFIIRPCAFGKSIFTNMLMAYYDKAEKANFSKNFSGTWIEKHPTPYANTFLMLKFNFSNISTEENTAESFIDRVRNGMVDFAKRYLPEDKKVQRILSTHYTYPSSLLMDFLDIVSFKLDEDIFIIVDDYDQFYYGTSYGDCDNPRSELYKNNEFKNFYTNIKSYSSGCIGSVFISGVTAITLDSMLSGYNIATDISNDSEFADAMGFSEDELRALIPQIVDITRYGHSVDEIFDRMKTLYGGYRFCSYSSATVFNPSICLYYLKEIAATNEEPVEHLNPNLSSDLSHIRKILSLGDQEFVEKVVSSILIDKPIMSFDISRAIDLSEGTLSRQDLLSMLVFKGFLTLSPDDPDQFVCPNRVVKDLFLRY